MLSRKRGLLGIGCLSIGVHTRHSSPAGTPDGILPLPCLVEGEEWVVPEQISGTEGPWVQQQGNPYTKDLLRLQQCTPVKDTKQSACLAEVNTPLQFSVWKKYLADHPDEAFRDYILEGIQQGFRVGFDYQGNKCHPAAGNLKSARENAGVVEEYIAKEVAARRVVGPLTPGEVPGLQTSPFGVIPKRQPGKWRLIVDLSAPEGGSVNDGIDGGLCSLQYVSVEDIVHKIEKMGKGTLLAKVDLKEAYRMVPVHPQDRPLLGMEWEGQVYVDTALPFGLRSAPKIFNALADALEWIVRHRGILEVDHYLDDFIIIGPPQSKGCANSLEVLLETCRQLGVPVAVHKCQGPTTCLEFLGIEIDTIAMELRLPQDKLTRLRTLIGEWRLRKACQKKDLQRLVGHLCHACKVVRPGRRFLRGMFSLLSGSRRSHHYIRLNRQFRADLEWWNVFLSRWNGASMLFEVNMREPQVTMQVPSVWTR